jgi:peptide/nickel transport system substrate-binding protein
MRAGPDGTLVPDLAESVDISNDGLIYNFRLKSGLTFHDGQPISASDVAFTVERALDGAIKSPRRANWEGVEVEQTGELEIVFRLSKAYAPFLENTTMGILPRHIWKDSPAEQFSFSTYNIEPVGSGPYKIKSIKRDESGVPLSANLIAFDNFALGKPFVEEIRFRFYLNESEAIGAYLRKDIDGLNSISPELTLDLHREGANILRSPLPRIFAVFFNHNQQPIFAEKAVREALSLALDKEQIIRQVLYGYGRVASSPIPAGSINPYDQVAGVISAEQSEQSVADRERSEAAAILSDAGWKLNATSGILEKKIGDKITALTFSLTTSDVPELKSAAMEIKRQWAELGVDTRIEIYEASDLNHNIIRPRKYDSLLFGEIVGRDLDLYAFWHSSQRTDPGLNIALYTNIAADKLLEDARAETNTELRLEKYRQFEQEIIKDSPAIFLYTPDFIYIAPNKLKNLKLGRIITPSERFINAHMWHIEEEGVWPIFIKQ